MPYPQLVDKLIPKNRSVMEEKQEPLYHLEDTEDFGLHQSEYEPIERDEDDVPPAFQEPTYYTEEDEEPESNQEGLIVAAIIGLLVAVGLAVYLFGFGGKEQVGSWFGNDAQVEPPVNPENAKPEAEPLVINEPEPEVSSEVSQPVEIAEEPTVAIGPAGSYSGIEAIAAPTGRSYIIVGSFVDEDMARDLGNKLAEQGVGIRILAPTSRAPLLHRVAVADYATFSDAVVEVEAYKLNYGERTWVLKY